MNKVTAGQVKTVKSEQCNCICIAAPLRGTPNKTRYFLFLLAVCLLVFLCVTATYWVNGRSLVWDTDGRLLYFPFMVQEGEWLRGVVSSVLDGNFAFPIYSFNYGFGADWLVSASGNTNELFNLFAAFCPPQFSEYLYGVLVFVRLYLAAVAFSLYCFSRGKGQAESFCGSLCYILCGYVLFWGVFRHPNFIDFAILLPLIFMGADRLFARKGPVLLILSTGALFAFSIYFTYMTCIFLLFYCLISYFVNPRDRSVGDFFRLVAKFALSLLAAFLLAGFSSFPMFISLTSMGRVGVERTLDFFQPADFYIDFIGQLLGDHIGPNAVVIGAVPVLCFAALLAGKTCFHRPERIGWGLGVILCLVGAMVSKVGSIMNGFGYPTDRWLLILGFCAAYVVVLAIPAFCRFRKKEWLRLAIVVAIVALWGIVGAVHERTLLSVSVVVMFVLIYGITVLVVSKAPIFHRESKQGKATISDGAVLALSVILSAAAVANVAIQANIFSSSLGSSYARQFIHFGQVYETREQLNLPEAIKDYDCSYRIDRSDISLGRNASFFQGYKGIDSYTSFYNQAIDDFRYSLGIADDVKSTMMNGVQRRAALDMLLGAKYFVASEGTAKLVPVGYERVADLGKAQNGREYYLYECDNILPLSFVYDSAVSQEAFDRLDMAQKQELMTKSVVLAEGGQQEVQPLMTSHSAAQVQETEDAIVQEGRIVAEKSGAQVVLRVDGLSESEGYLCFDNLHFESISSERAQEILDSDTEEVPESIGFEPATSVWLKVSADSGSHSFEVVTSASAKYAGKEDWAINLGYSEAPISEITVTFGKPGIYTYDDIFAAFQPIEEIEGNIRALKEANTASISFGVNSMDVHVEAETANPSESASGKSRYVFVSIPFSSGWSATVDGEPVEISKANVGFMSVEVDGSAHDISFSYITPGMVPGVICSVFSLFVLVILVFVRRRYLRVRDAKMITC